MTDQELAHYLELSPAEAAVILPRLTADERASYEALAELEIQLRLWQAGLAARPRAIVCSPRVRR